jgi:hypothetical protein
LPSIRIEIQRKSCRQVFTQDSVDHDTSPELERLATNSLGEATNASPVISDGDILIRTHEHLWCVRSAR